MKAFDPDGLRLIACDGDLLPRHREKLNEYADGLERLQAENERLRGLVRRLWHPDDGDVEVELRTLSTKSGVPVEPV